MKFCTIAAAVALCANGISLLAQVESSKQFVGTVNAVRSETPELEIKPDNGALLVVSVSPDSLIQRVAPGEKDLKKAEAIEARKIAVGDRVLVALEPGTRSIRRLVVMPASEIGKRDELDREAWSARGVSGVVTAKIANQITLVTRTFRGQVEVTVKTDEKTTYRRYQPESVRFSDAQPSSLAELKPGDQMRARGAKSEDGRTLDAEAVVFGSFQTKAGTISSVDVPAGLLTMKELGTGNMLTVRITPDSRLKQMPDFAAMGGGRGGPGGNGLPGGTDGPPPRGGGDMPPAFPGRGGPPGDFAQMIDAMPITSLASLKPGQTVVVSSTKGGSADSLTAVMLLANADMLIQMASARTGRGGRNKPDGGEGIQGGSGGASASGLSGFDLPGIIP